MAYLAHRNVAVISADIDTSDYKHPKPDALVKRVMALLKKRGKGIILMHDIQPPTVAALPEILKQLKNHGYNVVQLTAKEPVATLPEYDQQIREHQRHCDRSSNKSGRAIVEGRRGDGSSTLLRLSLSMHGTTLEVTASSRSPS